MAVAVRSPRTLRRPGRLAVVLVCALTFAAAACEPTEDRSSAAPSSAVPAPSTTAPATDAGSIPEPVTVPPPTKIPGERVVRVVDGDTVEMADGTTVRLIGIDTPERGECGYTEAAATLASLVMARPVTLSGGARDDTDRYGRLLRYLDTPDGDANLEMIRSGWARARYDSRDGYGHHLREDVYVAADAETPHRCGIDVVAPDPTQPAAPVATGASDPQFGSCEEAKRAGYGPYVSGSVEYGWYRDGDGDGTVCE